MSGLILSIFLLCGRRHIVQVVAEGSVDLLGVEGPGPAGLLPVVRGFQYPGEETRVPAVSLLPVPGLRVVREA